MVSIARADAGQPLLGRIAVGSPRWRCSRPGSATTGVLDLLYTLLFVLLIGVLAGQLRAMQPRIPIMPRHPDQHGHLVVSRSLPGCGSQEEPRLRHLFSAMCSLWLPLEEWSSSSMPRNGADPDVFRAAGWLHPFALVHRGHGEPVTHEVSWVPPAPVTFSHEGVEVNFYTDAPVNPAFALHLRLLTEIIGYFHAAKTRERAMQANAYTQAIYETGSRLTHDVKNLLQSLKTLCSAAEHSRPEQAMSLQSLMQRQLPQIAKRLEITLDKLKSPEKAADRREVLARMAQSKHMPATCSTDIDDRLMLWLPQSCRQWLIT
jgi:hypothetical protein